MKTKVVCLLIALFLAICVITLGLNAQSVEWTEVESGIYDLSPNPISLNGHDGYFYSYVSAASAPYSFVYRSMDGIEWGNVGQGASGTDAITLSNGEILLFGNSSRQSVVSDNGNWLTVPIVPDGEFAAARAAAEGADGQIVMGGTQGTWQVDPAWWVSTDGGKTFTYYKEDGRIGDVGVFEGISGLAYGNGLFLAVGYPGEVWTSTTGEVWEHTELPTVQYGGSDAIVRLNEVQFLDGTFYAVGDYSSIFKSNDGLQWELVYLGGNGGSLTELIVDGQNWHAAGPSGGQIWSTDGGNTWQSGPQRNKDFSDLVGGGGMLYAGGYFTPQGSAVNFFNSLDIDWFEGGWPMVAYTNGKWLVFYKGTAYVGTQPASFLDAATTSDGINFEHPWLGWFSTPSNGWIYHYNMGWIFSDSSSEENVWIFSGDLGWIYTKAGLWPYFYHAGSANWGSYGGGPEWFWNETSQRWETKEDFGKPDWLVSSDWLIGKTLTITDSTGTHTVEVVSATTVNATFNVTGKVLNFTTSDDVTWYDSSVAGALPEGHRFTFDIVDTTMPGIGDRVFPLVFTFEDSTGGVSLLTYTYLNGLVPVSGTSIEGTFTVSD